LFLSGQVEQPGVDPIVITRERLAPITAATPGLMESF
jgi:hypothetical protein